MKFPYSVKHNGIWYAPNTEVPTDEKAPVKEEPKAVEPVKEVVESAEEKVEDPKKFL